MKNLMILKTFVALLVVSCLVWSCSDESDDFLEIVETPTPEQESVGFDFSSTYSLEKYSLEEILDAVSSKYLGREDFDIVQRNGSSLQTGILFEIKDDRVIVTPIDDTPINPTDPTGPIMSLGDDAKCGGQAGDGWKSYGTCINPDCVKEKMTTASTELSASLGAGQCLEVRVKRNSLNARVCGRVISC